MLYLLLHTPLSLHPSVLRRAFGHIPTLTLQKLELVRFFLQGLKSHLYVLDMDV